MSLMSPDVLCVGLISVDVLMHGTVPAVEPGGHTSFVDDIGLSVGGDAANQAIALAKLGHSVGLMALVGDDLAGDLAVRTVERHGVDTSRIAVSSALSTSVCLVQVAAGGERSFVANRGGSAASFGPDHVRDSPLPAGLKVLSVGSLNCSRDLDAYVLPGLLAEARAAGVVTVVDLVTDHLDVGLDELAPVLQHVDYLLPSALEAQHYTGAGDPVEIAARFRHRGVGSVILKVGADGAILVGDEGTIHRFRPPPATVVDTTGAGDCFVAGFVGGLLENRAVEDCIRAGLTTAAWSNGAYGATTGIPELRQRSQSAKANP